VKTFLTFRFSTKCREIGKARRRLSLRSGSALNVGEKGKQDEDFPYVQVQHKMKGSRESKAKTFPTFRIYTKCREIGKARQRLFQRLEPALNAGK